MTINQILSWAEIQIQSPSPRLDAEVILSFVINKPKEFILSHGDMPVNVYHNLEYKHKIYKLLKGWPVAYITGRKEFYGREFIVNNSVLIPRPETEILIEKTLERINQDNSINTLADVGTGSGCIAITLALEKPSLTIYATDLSSRAITTAKLNAKLHNVFNRIIFKRGNLLNPLKNAPVDIIVANLPYVTDEELKSESTIKKEPILALRVNQNLISEFATQLKAFASLKFVIIETSPILAQNWSEQILRLYRPKKITLGKDLNNKNRFIH